MALPLAIALLVLLALVGVGSIVAAGRRPGGPGRGDGDDSSDDNGDGGCRRHPPRPSPGGPEPDWWPEFEREFAAYVAASHGRRSTAVRTGGRDR